MCPLDAPVEAFGPFQDLVSIWRKRIEPDRSLPRRGDVDMTDFAAWLGRIFIAKIERDPFNLRLTLWGTQLVEWWRVDYTGKTLGEQSTDPALWRVGELRYFERMDRAPFIGVASGILVLHKRSHIKVIGVDLPFSDGAGLSHVISAHLKIGVTESVKDVLPDCPIAAYEDA